MRRSATRFNQGSKLVSLSLAEAPFSSGPFVPAVDETAMRKRKKKKRSKRRRGLLSEYLGVQGEGGQWFYTLPVETGSAPLHGPFATEAEAAYARDQEIVKTRPFALLNFPPSVNYNRLQKLKLPPPERMYFSGRQHRVKHG